MPWILLAAAIVVEVAGTVALRFSDGFSRLTPSLVVAVCYLAAIVLLSQAVRGMPLSIAYATWAGAGTALVALIGVVALDEPLTVPQVLGTMLVIGGVTTLNLGGAH